MLWTRRPFSHIARKMRISFLDKDVYFHANETKVNWEYETHFLKKNKIVTSVVFPVTEKQYKDFNKASWEQVGDCYGALQNLGIVYVDIMNLFGKKVDNPWKKGQNCSELIYRTILIPLHPELSLNPDTIKPHHIERILREKYGK